MRYAKSIYRAGWIIDAGDCDYESSRDLGLICPFCSQAVYLIRGYERGQPEKRQVVSPAFGHYKSGDPLDCELRASRPDGVEYLEKLRIEGRNQRLELFNSRFWEVFSKASPNASKYEMKIYKEVFENSWVEPYSKLIRHEWARSLEDIYIELNAAYDLLVNLPATPLASEVEAAFTEFQKNQSKQEIAAYDRKIQIAVAQEAADFLATRTAGYAMAKLVLYSAAMLSKATFVGKTGKICTHSSEIWVFAKPVKKTHPWEFCKTIALSLVNANWTTMYKQLDDN